MNDRPNPLKQWRATRAYEDFTGHKASRVDKRRLDDSQVVGYRMGSTVGIAYEATRDGKTDQYFHRFKKAARPDLVAKDDGKQLYLSGGKYKITDRGIEDMPEMFVVNPSRRRRRKTATTRRRPSVMRRNPVRRRRRAARGRTTIYAVNPHRRRVRRRRSSARRMLRNPVRRRGYRRNPSGAGGFKIMSMIMPGLAIGAGAVMAEVATGYLPLPAAWKTGQLRYLTKATVGIGLGWALAKFANRRLGEAMAMGAIAISAHDAIKDMILAKMGGGVQMGGYNWNKYGYGTPMGGGQYTGLGFYSAGQTSHMGQYVGTQGMGEYVHV